MQGLVTLTYTNSAVPNAVINNAISVNVNETTHQVTIIVDETQLASIEAQ